MFTLLLIPKAVHGYESSSSVLIGDHIQRNIQPWAAVCFALFNQWLCRAVSQCPSELTRWLRRAVSHRTISASLRRPAIIPICEPLPVKQNMPDDEE